MMKKHIFLTLLLTIVAQGAWVQVIGGNYYPKVLDSPPTEGPWTFDAVITHSASNVSTLSFNGANRNTWQDYNGTDELEHKSHSKVYQWQDGEGLGFTICAKSIEGESFGVLSTYFHREGVPSYTRYRLRWTYTLKSRTDDDVQCLGQCIALYMNESLEDIKNLVVNLDENYGHETEEGRAHAVSHFVLLEENRKEETERRTLFLDLDNRDGATDQTKEKALMAVYSIQKGFVSYNEYTAMVSIHQWTSFKSYGLVRDTYYYKYVTFDANGGVGTMSGQEIENNGKLNTARFARTGYTFQGWAKTPNGAVVYADGAEITATEADKGPVTLYAVWKANPANVVAMINTIGEVVCTDECKARIDAARAVYDALSAEDKALVTNYSVLQAAETTYAAVEDVVTKINAIGSVSYPGSGTAITTAQTAYEALTAEQKAIVINVGVLSTAQDQYAVLEVANQISAIGDVSYPESGTAIAAARTAYDALSAGQKTQVSNYGTLLTAETAYQQAKEDAGNTTINFVDEDDATLRNQKRTLNYPEAPEVENYVFQYWQAMDGSLSGGNLIVKAIYAPSSITLNESDDNSSAITAVNDCTLDVTLTRTLQTGSWNTFAVPFSIAIPTGWTVKELTNAYVSGSTLTLTFGDASSIEAGKPYLVKVESVVANPTFDDVTVSSTPAPTEFAGVITFVPTFGLTTLPSPKEKILFLATGNKLKRPSAEGQKLKGFRAYFQLDGEALSAQSFSLDLGDEATAVEMITADDAQAAGSADAYNLAGQRVGEDYKGIVIVNGKKVVK